VLVVDRRVRFWAVVVVVAFGPVVSRLVLVVPLRRSVAPTEVAVEGAGCPVEIVPTRDVRLFLPFAVVDEAEEVVLVTARPFSPRLGGL
jgi:hypothetical protein